MPIGPLQITLKPPFLVFVGCLLPGYPFFISDFLETPPVHDHLWLQSGL